MKKSKWLSVALVSSLVLTYLTGCGTTPNATSGKPDAASTTKPVDASKPKELLIYSSIGFDKEAAKAFETKTGIQVKLVDDSAGNLLAKVQAERSNPHWDILWIEGNASMQTLDTQGALLTGWTPKNADNYTDLGKSLLPSDKAYFPNGTSAAGIIAYNTKLVTPDQAPKDWSDLLKPEFKGSFSISDPNISGPAYPIVADILKNMGTDKGKSFFTDLKKNGMQVMTSGGAGVKAVVSGSEKVAILQDNAILKEKVNGSPVELVYPKSGAAMLSMYMGIQKNAANMDAAKQFVDFILSEQNQKDMISLDAGQSYYQPIIKNVIPKPVRPQDGIKWNLVDPTWASQNETELKKWFHDNVVQ